MIAVQLVSGALGAGKSTWLAEQMATPGAELRLVVNDVAGAMPDDDLLDGPHVTRLVGGCVCCDAAPALVAHLRSICEDVHGGVRVGRVVLEASGVSDPTAIAELIRTDPVLIGSFVVDEVVVVVDGLLAGREMRHDPLIVRQVRAADRVVVSKTDLVTAAEATSLVATVRGVAPMAHVSLSPNTHGLVPEDIAPEVATASAGRREVLPPSSVVTIDLDARVDWVTLATWLAALLHAHGEQVLRLKAAVPTPAGPLALNVVRGVMHAPRPRDRPIEEPRLTLVVRDLDPTEVALGWEHFRAAAGAPAHTDQETHP